MITNINKRTKRQISLLFVICSLFFSTSCDDMLETVPQGQFTAEQLSASPESLEGLIASAYAGLEAHFIGNNEAFAGPSTNWIFDVRSDDAYKGGDGPGMEANIHLLEISEISSNNVSGLDKWRNNYWAIVRVHKAMTILKDASSASNADQLMGEMKALRAWFYFDLYRLFKRIPYATEDEDLTTKTNDEYSRDEIYSFIKKDLTEAIAVLPNEKDNGGHITRPVAQAILARVCAFGNSQGAEWNLVIENCDAIIQSGFYSLYPNFGDLSKIDHNNGAESIFALQVSTANNNAHINWSNLLNCTYSEGNLYGLGDDFFYASQNLVNAFRTDPNTGLPYLDGTFNSVNVTLDYAGTLDPRLDYTVGRIGMPWRGHTYNENWCRAYATYGEYSNKKAWPAPEECYNDWPWGCNALNFMFIRYADILLLKAEALIETSTAANAQPEVDTDGKLTEARALINQVRQRAANTCAEDVITSYQPVDLDPFLAEYKVGLYPTDVNGNLTWNKNYARAALRMERRLELALEGNRWFDLMRWGNDYLIQTMNKYMQEESKLRPYYEGASVTENEIFLLVPLTEIDNSNGLYKQY